MARLRNQSLARFFSTLARIAHTPKFGDEAIAAFQEYDKEFNLYVPMERSKMSLREACEYIDCFRNGTLTDPVRIIQDHLTNIRSDIYNLIVDIDHRLGMFGSVSNNATRDALWRDLDTVSGFQQVIFRWTGLRGQRDVDQEASENAALH